MCGNCSARLTDAIFTNKADAEAGETAYHVGMMVKDLPLTAKITLQDNGKWRVNDPRLGYHDYHTNFDSLEDAKILCGDHGWACEVAPLHTGGTNLPNKLQYEIHELSVGKFKWRVTGGISKDDYWDFESHAEAVEWCEKDGEVVKTIYAEDVRDTPKTTGQIIGEIIDVGINKWIKSVVGTDDYEDADDLLSELFCDLEERLNRKPLTTA